MSNIHTLSSGKASRKRQRSPERKVMLTVKNGISTVQRDAEGNALYCAPEPKRRKTDESAGQGKIRKSSSKGPVRVKDSATEGRWRMSRTEDKRVTEKLSDSIAKSHLYPIATLTVVTDSEDHWTVEWKDTGNSNQAAALAALSPWILVGHGDGHEAAVVVSGVVVGATSAKIPKSTCKLSVGKLKKALVCAGPQATTPACTLELAEAFPKTKRALSLAFVTFERLQRECGSS